MIWNLQFDNIFSLYVIIMLTIKQIGPFQPTKGKHAKLKVMVGLSMHGNVSVDTAIVSCWKAV